jgi:hypothetical protein
VIDISHVGAFLSGVAAVVTAIASSRMARKRYQEECNQRIKDIRASFREGFKMGERK